MTAPLERRLGERSLTLTGQDALREPADDLALLPAPDDLAAA